MMKRCDCNPLNDYLFKFIFGREERKRITLSFLIASLIRSLRTINSRGWISLVLQTTVAVSTSKFSL